MLKEERHQTILNEVELHNRVVLTNIAESLNVSVDTVRRDVKELDTTNKLRKVHGGAISLGFTDYKLTHSNIYALDEKVKIARKAVKLIKNGHVLLIDGGATCLELARAIPTKFELTCFTLSLSVAQELLTKPNIKVVFIGGELSKDAQIAIGASVVHQLSEIQVDYSFVGTGYVDTHDGLTEFDLEIVHVKKAVIAAAKKAILLSISEKINSRYRYKTCAINAIDTMITELDPMAKQLTSFRKKELHLL